MFDWVLNTFLYFSYKFPLSYATVYQKFIRKDYFDLTEVKG